MRTLKGYDLKISDRNAKVDEEKSDMFEESVESSCQEELSELHDNVQTSMPYDCLSGNLIQKAGDSGSDGNDAHKERPLSPATVALMCDEDDAIFMPDRFHDGASSCNGNVTVKSSQQHTITQTYAEQERIVLAKFCNVLNRLITCGSIKGKSFIN